MNSRPRNKYNWRPLLLCGGVLWGTLTRADPTPESTTPQLSVRVVAETQTRISDHGVQDVRMVAADKVVPGDLVYYTLEVRNKGATSLQSPRVVQPVPVHTVYVANSATCPGCVISFSADGGRSFARPEVLKATLPDGSQRPAVERDYTHIRFALASLVKADSVAYLRFRARVK
jgi:uncharacterized repeat protein (TIGR01451 family)